MNIPSEGTHTADDQKGSAPHFSERIWFWLIVFFVPSFFLAHPFKLLFGLFLPLGFWGLAVNPSVLGFVSVPAYIAGFIVAKRYIAGLHTRLSKVVTNLCALFLLAMLVDLLVWRRLQTILLLIDSIFGTSIS